MKGIILAGGTGSRLWPVTQAISKQLMPIYDKPMIYYPLSTLIRMNITEILIITRPEEQDQFVRLLGDGSRLGISIEYKSQPTPDGLAQAFILGEDFIGSDTVALILGDNIFHGAGFNRPNVTFATDTFGARVYAYQVADPERYGVVEFDGAGNVLSIEEKPNRPRSRYAVPGLYLYDNSVLEVARNLKPSDRGELEITDVNRVYLQRRQLKVVKVERGAAWLDTGTFESMIQATEYVKAVEDRTGVKLGCIEEETWRRGNITRADLVTLALPLQASGYGSYLLDLLDA